MCSGVYGGRAASFSSEGSGGSRAIFVAGPLEPGDQSKFIDIALPLSNAVVVFNSPGGSLKAGLEIGRAIRLKGFATAVPDGAACASACAFAWLGGGARWMGASARI